MFALFDALVWGEPLNSA